MTAKIIGVLNQKGGVGKTTTSVNLSSAFATLGKKVLAIDIDPQGNLSTHLGIITGDDLQNSGLKAVPEFSIYDVLKGIKNVKEVVVSRSENLDIIPASLLLSAADLELGGVVGRELLLKKALLPAKNNYDYIVIDCPPALGLLTLNVLAVADQIIIPVQSEYLALHGVRQLLDTIDQVRTIYNQDLVVGGVLICLHDSRKRLARAVSDTIHDYFGELVFDSVIRSNVALAEAPASGQNIFEYSPKSSGAEDYMNLAQEITKNV